MWTSDSASAAFSLAMRRTIAGDYADALRDFELLLKPDPDAYRFFVGFQHSYVIIGAQRLAEVYPPAQAVVDEWVRNNPWPF